MSFFPGRADSTTNGMIRQAGGRAVGRGDFDNVYCQASLHAGCRFLEVSAQRGTIEAKRVLSLRRASGPARVPPSDKPPPPHSTAPRRPSLVFFSPPTTPLLKASARGGRLHTPLVNTSIGYRRRSPNQLRGLTRPRSCLVTRIPYSVA